MRKSSKRSQLKKSVSSFNLEKAISFRLATRKLQSLKYKLAYFAVGVASVY